MCSWQKRRIKDTYRRRAQQEGVRNRAAFKLMQLDDRFHLLRARSVVVDVGSAPGGFATVVARRVHLDPQQAWDAGRDTRSSSLHPRPHFGQLVCVDVDTANMSAVRGASVVCGDVRHARTATRVLKRLVRRADVVLSDAAPRTTGDSTRDHVASMSVARGVAQLAEHVLAARGTLVLKVFGGRDEAALARALRARFESVRAARVGASDRRSRELYYVCRAFSPRRAAAAAAQAPLALDCHTS
ncbi:unnamed protein product [Agarophyton chilense]